MPKSASSPSKTLKTAASSLRPSRKARIHILRSDRMFIVGTTGSGKSYLARKLSAPLPYVIVVDPKHQWEWGKERLPYGKGPTVSQLDALIKHEEPSPVIYRPSYDEQKAGLDGFFRWVFFRGNTLVVIDEVASITPSTALPRDFAIAIQQGRSRNLGLWMLTQRPSRIPIPILSESEHHAIFRLRHPNDLKRMAEYTDPIVEAYPARDHNFWYYNDRTQQVMLLNANILL